MFNMSKLSQYLYPVYCNTADNLIIGLFGLMVSGGILYSIKNIPSLKDFKMNLKDCFYIGCFMAPIFILTDFCIRKRINF